MDSAGNRLLRAWGRWVVAWASHFIRGGHRFPGRVAFSGRGHGQGQTCTKYNDGKSGYLAQSVLLLYFGMGDASRTDRVEVDWPSGRKQLIRAGVEENQTLVITEPK